MTELSLSYFIFPQKIIKIYRSKSIRELVTYSPPFFLGGGLTHGQGGGFSSPESRPVFNNVRTLIYSITPHPPPHPGGTRASQFGEYLASQFGETAK